MKAIFNIEYTTATPPATYTGEKRAEYIAERNFYNLTADYNYLHTRLTDRRLPRMQTQSITSRVKAPTPGFLTCTVQSTKKRKTRLKRS